MADAPNTFNKMNSYYNAIFSPLLEGSGEAGGVGGGQQSNNFQNNENINFQKTKQS